MNPRRPGLLARLQGWLSPRPPVYFLHVSKCAGTTVRLILQNGFAAAEMLDPLNLDYHRRDLSSWRELHDPWRLSCGHFGWMLPLALGKRPLRIATVLREPVERLLSEFDYLRQHRRIDPSLSAEEWFSRRIQFNHLATSYFVPDRWREIQGFESVVAAAEACIDTALANLARCDAVGVQEEMEDTVNLLCWKTNCLPPLETLRMNRTVQRTPLEGVAPAVREKILRLAKVDGRLHTRAREIFSRQRDAMYASLAAQAGHALNSTALRPWLHASLLRERLRPPISRWVPEDVLLGEGMHDREKHGEASLRWTGPRNTTIYFAPGRNRPREMHLRLHPATPSAHVEGLQAWINGQEVSLTRSISAGGPIVQGVFDGKILPVNGPTRLTLAFPTARGAGEFRALGVALQEIHLAPSNR